MAEIAPIKLARGPAVGAPPVLQMLPIDVLNVDVTYQRPIDSPASRKLIGGMMKLWDWSLCLPGVVNRREDGSFWLLDGQHRREGARQRGDVPHLPFIVHFGLTPKAEAKLFMALNQKRNKLVQTDVFNGMLATGDAASLAVAAEIDACGWRIVRHANTAVYKPGDLACAPMLTAEYRQRGIEPVRFALRVLRAAYPDKPVRQGSTMLQGLLGFHAEDQDRDEGKLARVLAAHDPYYWITRALEHHRKFPGFSRPRALAAVLLGQDKATPQPAKPAALRPAPTASDLFKATGSAWCNQCDKMVAFQKAATCGSSFCSLRRFT